MNTRIYSASVIAVFILVTCLIAAPARSGQTADDSPKLAASSANLFEGMLAIKEGHGDILVRPENGNDKRFKVKESTVITRNGKPATYDDLRARDQLRVHYGPNRVVIELNATGS